MWRRCGFLLWPGQRGGRKGSANELPAPIWVDAFPSEKPKRPCSAFFLYQVYRLPSASAQGVAVCVLGMLR
jgi:hypothetical protein